jgi:two-component system chemotaxis sensor kinase CheA
VQLEEDPGDRPTLDAVFRVAHSLKGMAGTMGFAEMARLTHQMEDVLELLRQRDSGLPEQATDVLLACLDQLTEAVDSIESDGDEGFDPRELVERLAVLVRDRDEPRENAAPPVFSAPPSGGVRVTLGPATMMPSVRAFQVLTVLEETCEVRSSTPSLENVETFSGTEIIADVICSTPDDLALALRRVTDVADVSVSDTAAPAPAEPEQAAQLKVVEPKERNVLDHERSTAKASPTVRVDADRLDQLMHLLGEAQVKRTRVESLVAGLEIPELQESMNDLKGTSRELQQMVMRVRMISVDAVFVRFPRLVRDVSSKLGKSVELTIAGQDTELDRTVVDAIGDPLVHLIRNALDHGIESPEERIAAGKPEAGHLQISARHAGGSIVISVVDDGRGVQPEAIASRAVERGLIAPHELSTIDLPAAIELYDRPAAAAAHAGDHAGPARRG